MRAGGRCYVVLPRAVKATGWRPPVPYLMASTGEQPFGTFQDVLNFRRYLSEIGSQDTRHTSQSLSGHAPEKSVFQRADSVCHGRFVRELQFSALKFATYVDKS